MVSSIKTILQTILWDDQIINSSHIPFCFVFLVSGSFCPHGKQGETSCRATIPRSLAVPCRVALDVLPPGSWWLGWGFTWLGETRCFTIGSKWSWGTLVWTWEWLRFLYDFVLSFQEICEETNDMISWLQFLGILGFRLGCQNHLDILEQPRATLSFWLNDISCQKWAWGLNLHQKKSPRLVLDP